jgi:transposase
MMDTYTQPVTTKRQYRTLEEKQRIVGEALAEGASVARVARAHGVNANLVFNWCRLYRAGRLRRRSEAKLLPVRVTGESSSPPPALCAEPGGLLAASSAGTIHIQLQHAQVRVESGANPRHPRSFLSQKVLSIAEGANRSTMGKMSHYCIVAKQTQEKGREPGTA